MEVDAHTEREKGSRFWGAHEQMEKIVPLADNFVSCSNSNPCAPTAGGVQRKNTSPARLWGVKNSFLKIIFALTLIKGKSEWSESEKVSTRHCELGRQRRPCEEEHG